MFLFKKFFQIINNMKKFKLFDNSYFKLINERRSDKININSDNETRVNKSIKKQAKRKKKKK